MNKLKIFIILILSVFVVQDVNSAHFEGPVEPLVKHESIFEVRPSESGSEVFFGDKPVEVSPEQRAAIEQGQMPLDEQQALVLEKVGDGKDYPLVEARDGGGYVNLLSPSKDPVKVQSGTVFPSGLENDPRAQAAFLANNDAEIHSVVVTKTPDFAKTLEADYGLSDEVIANAYDAKLEQWTGEINLLKQSLPNGELTEANKRQLLQYKAKIEGLNTNSTEKASLLRKIDDLLNLADEGIGGSTASSEAGPIIDDEDMPVPVTPKQTLTSEQLAIFKKEYAQLIALEGPSSVSQDPAEHQRMLRRVEIFQDKINQYSAERLTSGEQETFEDLQNMSNSMYNDVYKRVNPPGEIPVESYSGFGFMQEQMVLYEDPFYNPNVDSAAVSAMSDAGASIDQAQMAQDQAESKAVFALADSKMSLAEAKILQALSSHLNMYADSGSKGQLNMIDQWVKLAKQFIGKVDAAQEGSLDLTKLEQLAGDFFAKENPSSTERSQFVKQLQQELSAQVKNVLKALKNHTDVLEAGVKVAIGQGESVQFLTADYDATLSDLAPAINDLAALKANLDSALAPKSLGQKIGDFFRGLGTKIRSWFSSRPQSAPEPFIKVDDAVSTLNSAENALNTAGTIKNFVDGGAQFTSVAEQKNALDSLRGHQAALENAMGEIQQLKDNLIALGATESDPIINDLNDTIKGLKAEKMRLITSFNKSFTIDLYGVDVMVGDRMQTLSVSELVNKALDFQDFFNENRSIANAAQLARMERSLQQIVNAIRVDGIADAQMVLSDGKSPVTALDDLHATIQTAMAEYEGRFNRRFDSVSSGTEATILELALLEAQLPLVRNVQGSSIEPQIQSMRAKIFEKARSSESETNEQIAEKLSAKLEAYKDAQSVAQKAGTAQAQLQQQYGSILDSYTQLVQRQQAVNALGQKLTSYQQEMNKPESKRNQSVIDNLVRDIVSIARDLGIQKVSRSKSTGKITVDIASAEVSFNALKKQAQNDLGELKIATQKQAQRIDSALQSAPDSKFLDGTITVGSVRGSLESAATQLYNSSTSLQGKELSLAPALDALQFPNIGQR